MGGGSAGALHQTIRGGQAPPIPTLPPNLAKDKGGKGFSESISK